MSNLLIDLFPLRSSRGIILYFLFRFERHLKRRKIQLSALSLFAQQKTHEREQSIFISQMTDASVQHKTTTTRLSSMTRPVPCALKSADVQIVPTNFESMALHLVWVSDWNTMRTDIGHGCKVVGWAISTAQWVFLSHWSLNASGSDVR